MASKYKKSSKIISVKDDISLGESLALIAHHKLDQKSGLVLPIDLVTEREKICGYCGEPFDKLSKGRYFGEIFHAKCCEAMLRGERAT